MEPPRPCRGDCVHRLGSGPCGGRGHPGESCLGGRATDLRGPPGRAVKRRGESGPNPATGGGARETGGTRSLGLYAELDVHRALIGHFEARVESGSSVLGQAGTQEQRLRSSGLHGLLLGRKKGREGVNPVGSAGTKTRLRRDPVPVSAPVQAKQEGPHGWSGRLGRGGIPAYSESARLVAPRRRAISSSMPRSIRG